MAAACDVSGIKQRYIARIIVLTRIDHLPMCSCRQRQGLVARDTQIADHIDLPTLSSGPAGVTFTRFGVCRLTIAEASRKTASVKNPNTSLEVVGPVPPGAD